MTDTNTSGAKILAAMESASALLDIAECPATSRKIDKARTAVAALIDREAAQAARISELEAECAGLKRYWELANAAVSDLQNRITERDALAAEVKALRSAFVEERARYHRSQGAKIEQAQILAETDVSVAYTALARASAATGGGNG